MNIQNTLNVKLIEENNLSIKGSIEGFETIYFFQEFSGKFINLIINNGMPIKFNESSYQEIITPLGWHKGKLHINTFKSFSLQIAWIEFYDDSSCLLVNDEINNSFVDSKKILLGISTEKCWESIEKMKIAKTRMDKEYPLDVIKNMYKNDYKLRVVN